MHARTNTHADTPIYTRFTMHQQHTHTHSLACAHHTFSTHTQHTLPFLTHHLHKHNAVHHSCAHTATTLLLWCTRGSLTHPHTTSHTPPLTHHTPHTTHHTPLPHYNTPMTLMQINLSTLPTTNTHRRIHIPPSTDSPPLITPSPQHTVMS